MSVRDKEYMRNLLRELLYNIFGSKTDKQLGNQNLCNF